MHEIEQKEEEDNSLKGKLVAFFDIERDPLVKAFKDKTKPKEEKTSEWAYV
jgi:hypothetical protein